MYPCLVDILIVHSLWMHTSQGIARTFNISGRHAVTHLEWNPSFDTFRQHFSHSSIEVCQNLHGKLWLNSIVCDELIECIHKATADARSTIEFIVWLSSWSCHVGRLCKIEERLGVESSGRETWNTWWWQRDVFFCSITDCVELVNGTREMEMLWVVGRQCGRGYS